MPSVTHNVGLVCEDNRASALISVQRGIVSNWCLPPRTLSPNKLLVHITALQVRLVCNGGSVLLVSRALTFRTFRTTFASNACQSSCVIVVLLRKTTPMTLLPLTRHVPNDIDHKFVLLTLRSRRRRSWSRRRAHYTRMTSTRHVRHR